MFRHDTFKSYSLIYSFIQELYLNAHCVQGLGLGAMGRKLNKA